MEICIVAPLKSADPTYSVAGVIKSQVALLATHRHKVTVIVNEDFSGSGMPGAVLQKLLPSTELTDYKSKLNISKKHEEFANDVAVILSSRIPQYDIIITHDIIFTGWNLPYALALMSVAAENENEDLRWFHWIHSFPFSNRDWWDINHYAGNHTVVYPTKAALKQVGEAFNATKIKCVPHVVDPRVINRFIDQTKDIIELVPAILSADIVQVYPAATDRFESKGIRELTNLFGMLKKAGHSVCLIIPNQFSGRRDNRLIDPITYYENVARRCGLEPYVDYVFTSELMGGKYKDGLPQRVLFELMTLSNLFVIPSKSESFGLGLLEAVTSGTVVCVANEHLNLPIHQYTSFDFKGPGESDMFIDASKMSELVDWISNEMMTNPIVKTKTTVRQQFNPTAVYNNHYKKLLRTSRKKEVRPRCYDVAEVE
jgi:hypothetical protein